MDTNAIKRDNCPMAGKAARANAIRAKSSTCADRVERLPPSAPSLGNRLIFFR
jgi:hypothetical protein